MNSHFDLQFIIITEFITRSAQIILFFQIIFFSTRALCGGQKNTCFLLLPHLVTSTAVGSVSGDGTVEQAFGIVFCKPWLYLATYCKYYLQFHNIQEHIYESMLVFLIVIIY